MKKLNWCCFVSQTGTEVMSLAKALNVVPSLLVTNNPKKLREEVILFLKDNGCELRVVPFNPLLEQYLQEDILSSNIITLHGYLRILPGEFIQSYRPRAIYNGHPAPIHPKHYPELKGKDPVERLWEGREWYKSIGTVIHEVVEGVDEGSIIYYNNSSIIGIETREQMYNRTKELSLQLWIEFMKDMLFKL